MTSISHFGYYLMKIRNLALLGLICYSCSLNAQIDYDKYPNSNKSLLLKNALVVYDANKTPTLQDILIKKGKLDRIASNISAPYDAKIVDLDSMFVYPGFIAALSHVGIKKEEEKDQPKIKFQGAPTNKQAGITPEKTIKSQLDVNESSIEKFRSNGITTANTVAPGKMITGTSALVSMSGDQTQRMIINETTGVFSQFKSSGNVYPKTIIGNMAKWRDLYHNAKNASNHIKNFSTNPSLTDRPAYDDATTALIPVVNNTIPVFFKTSNAKEMYRAYELKKELGFNLVFSECRQAWFAKQLTKNVGVNTLLSIKLPKEIKEKKEEDLTDEQKKLNQKKKEAYRNYLAQAALLEKEGIGFSFSFIDGKVSELKKNILKMVEAGLSKKKALEALSLYPAKLLKIDRLYGSIQQGKYANLVVTDNDYFDEKSKIKYVIVEGELFDYSTKKEKKSNTGEGAIDIEGTWDYEAEIFGQAQTGKVTVETADEE